MKEKKNLNLKHHLQNALIIGSYYQVLLTLSCWLKAEHYHSCFTLCTDTQGAVRPRSQGCGQADLTLACRIMTGLCTG